MAALNFQSQNPLTQPLSEPEPIPTKTNFNPFKREKNLISLGFSPSSFQIEFFMKDFSLFYKRKNNTMTTQRIGLNTNEETFFNINDMNLKTNHFALIYKVSQFPFNLKARFNYEEYKSTFNSNKIYPNRKSRENNIIFGEIVDETAGFKQYGATHFLYSSFIGLEIERILTKKSSIYFINHSTPLIYKEITRKESMNLNQAKANFYLQITENILGYKFDRFYIEAEQKTVFYFYETKFQILSNSREKNLDAFTSRRLEDNEVQKKQFNSIFLGMSFYI